MDNQEIIPAEAPHPFLPFIENAWYKTREGKRVQFKFCTGGVFPYPNIFLNEEKQFVTYTENGISNTGVFQGSKDIIALLEVPLNKCNLEHSEMVFLTGVLNGFLQRMKEANVDEKSINRARNMKDSILYKITGIPVYYEEVTKKVDD